MTQDTRPHPVTPEPIEDPHVFLCVGGPLNGHLQPDLGPRIESGTATYIRMFAAPPDRTPTHPPGHDPATSRATTPHVSYHHVYVLDGMPLDEATRRLHVLLNAPPGARR